MPRQNIGAKCYDEIKYESVVFNLVFSHVHNIFDWCALVTETMLFILDKTWPKTKGRTIHEKSPNKPGILMLSERSSITSALLHLTER